MTELPSLSVWISGAPLTPDQCAIVAPLVPFGSEPIGCVPSISGLNVAFRTESGQRGQAFFVLQSTEIEPPEPQAR
jgi:hypothetical protein